MASATWPRQDLSSCDSRVIFIEAESYSEATSDSSSVLSSVTHSGMSSTTSSASSTNSEGSRNTLLTDVNQDNNSTSADSTLTSVSCRCNRHTPCQGYQLPSVSRTCIGCIEISSNVSDASSREPEEPSTEKVTSKKSRRCLKISLALIVFVGISAGVAVAMLLLLSNKSTLPPVFTESDIIVRVINETFEDAMKESTSSEFKDFGAKFCTNVLSALTEKVNDARCQVNTLSPGSIVVNFTLELLAPENVTLHVLEQWLSVATLGVMTLDPSSLRVLSNASEKEFHLNKDPPSSCSAELLPLQPLSYTFPHHCQDYQVCVDGTPRLEKCQDGQEFAYTSPEDEIVCAPPSPLTYCGRKRRQTETEQTTTTITPTTKITSQDLAPPSTTAPTLPLLSSPHIDTRTPMIMSPTKSTEGVLSTLDGVSVSFTCPKTGQHFLPAVDTYPSNCGKYQQCNNGHSYNMTCSQGTVYIHAQYVCDSVQNPMAFCNLMEKGIFRAI